MRRWLVCSAITFVLMVTIHTPASSTPAREAPWTPEAAAYRLSLFLGNLAPVDWLEIERAWSEPYRGSEFPWGALEHVERVSNLETAALLKAIDRKELQALFGEATRFIARRIEEELDRVQSAKSPATAQQSVAQAQALYRAFADDIAAADGIAARRLGLAWLELANSVGSAGILGRGEAASNDEAMVRARNIISDYLARNYLVATFAPRNPLNALPETVVARGDVVEIPARLPPGSDILDQDPLPRLVLNFEEQGIEETDLPLIAYGDMLFDSPRIFGGPASEIGIACSTCHNRSDINQRLFIPGASHQPGSVDVDGAFFNPMFNDRRDDPIDIPSLRGLRFTGPYGRDGRFASLRDFTRNVIVNEFGGDEPTPFMLDALVGYMLEFDFLPNAMLSSDGRLTLSASSEARRGEVIFNQPFDGMNGRSCASCHVPDANFLDRRAHDIGSVTATYEGARAGALDTPTVLGTAYTAPYFHDGSLPTLASVVDWFDETKSLGLSDNERADLTAYLETVGAADEPYEVFDTENTAFKLAFDELTTFASTLDTLLPLHDSQHILLLTDTVAADLAADASTMSNLAARPEVYHLAEVLAEVGSAVRKGDWDKAESSWATFKSAAQEVAGRAF